MSNKTTLLPDYVSIVQEPSIEFYKTATNLMSSFSTYTGELSVAIDFEKSKIDNNVINSSAKLYKALNENDFKVTVDSTTYSFDNIFKLFYIEKFQSLTADLKTLITQSFSASNIYFTNYSDDTGNIVDTTSIVDSNTSPYFDINNTLFAYPTNIAASLYNKVSRNELTTSVNLGILTDAILKTNIKGLQGSVDTQTALTSHGENLVTDNLYINRVYDYSDTIKSQLKNVIGNMADFINFFKQVNYRDQDPSRKALLLAYKANVEGTEVAIDILKNKLDKSAPNTLTVTQSTDETTISTPIATVDTVIV